jgi:hypothetical protein
VALAGGVAAVYGGGEVVDGEQGFASVPMVATARLGPAHGGGGRRMEAAAERRLR